MMIRILVYSQLVQKSCNFLVTISSQCDNHSFMIFPLLLHCYTGLY